MFRERRVPDERRNRGAWSWLRRPAHEIEDGSRLGVSIVTAIVCGVVSSPLLFSRGPFWHDWNNHLWTLNAASPQPGSAFLHNRTLGIFYPEYAFYGGPLYTVGKLFSELLGDRPLVAYILLWIVGLVGAYCSLYGIARRVGVSPLYAHVPAILYTTTPYTLTNMYGRGAFTEFMATASIPLVAYGVIAYVGDHRPRRSALVALAAGLFLLTGSHVITLLFGSIFLLFLLWIGWTELEAVRERIRIDNPKILPVMGTASLVLVANLWHLVPQFVLNSTVGTEWLRGIPEGQVNLSTLAIVFSPSPRVSKFSTTLDLYLQISLPFLVWTAVTVLFARMKGVRTVHWPLVAWFVGLLVLFLTLVTARPLWTVLPPLFDFVQFPYRLLTYVTFALAGLCMAALRGLDGLRSGRSALVKGLFAAVVISIAVAGWQAWTTQGQGVSRTTALGGSEEVPMTWYDPGSYHDYSLPIVPTDPTRVVEVAPSRVDGDAFDGDVSTPRGRGPIATNIATGDRFLAVEGARIVGRTEAGFLVLEPYDSSLPSMHLTIHRRPGSVPDIARRVSMTTPILALSLVVVWLRRSRSQPERKDVS